MRSPPALHLSVGLLLLALHFGGWQAPPPAQPGVQPLTSPVLHLVGNHFFDAYNHPVTLRGASRWSLEFSCTGDGHFTSVDFLAMRRWGMNAVRLPLNSTYWLHGDGRGCSAQHYQQTVANAVTQAEHVGLYVLLVGQWSAQRDNSPMAYPQDRQFLKELALTYKDDFHVGFVPVTEPHGVSWDAWYSGWQGGPGMRECVDILSTNAPGHMIFVNGIDWGNNLDFLRNGHAITGPTIAYEVHIYQYWNPARFDPLMAQYAIIAGEFGLNDTQHDYVTEVMTYFEAHGTGYFAWPWAWIRRGSACDPQALLLCGHWDGTPTTAPTGNANGLSFGMRVRTFMLAHQSTVPLPPPSPVPSPSAILEDDLTDLRHLAAYSPGMTIDGTNADLLGQDTARLSRGQTTTAAVFATWHQLGMAQMTATLYRWPFEPYGLLTVATSADGQQWRSVSPQVTMTPPSGPPGTWETIIYHLAVPPGTAYIRFTWPAGGHPWNDQLGRVVLATTSAPIALDGDSRPAATTTPAIPLKNDHPAIDHEPDRPTSPAIA